MALSNPTTPVMPVLSNTSNSPWHTHSEVSPGNATTQRMFEPPGNARPVPCPRPRPGPSRNRPARFPAPTPDRRSSCLIRCQTHRCRHFLDSQEPSFWLTGTRESIKEPDDAGVLIPPAPSPPTPSKLNAQDVQEQVPTPNTFILITYSWVLWHDW